MSVEQRMAKALGEILPGMRVEWDFVRWRATSEDVSSTTLTGHTVIQTGTAVVNIKGSGTWWVDVDAKHGGGSIKKGAELRPIQGDDDAKA